MKAKIESVLSSYDAAMVTFCIEMPSKTNWQVVELIHSFLKNLSYTIFVIKLILKKRFLFSILSLVIGFLICSSLIYPVLFRWQNNTILIARFTRWKFCKMEMKCQIPFLTRVFATPDLTSHNKYKYNYLFLPIRLQIRSYMNFNKGVLQLHKLKSLREIACQEKPNYSKSLENNWWAL